MSIRTQTGTGSGTGAPPDLTFAVEQVEADRFALAPTLVFKLAIERSGGGTVRSVALNAQIRVAATRRSYDTGEQERLLEVFGPPEGVVTKPAQLPWTTTTVQVPSFEDATVVDLPIACTYDLEVASAQYFHSLEGGEIPLEVLFSGTIFYAERDGQLGSPTSRGRRRRSIACRWRCGGR